MLYTVEFYSKGYRCYDNMDWLTSTADLEDVHMIMDSQGNIFDNRKMQEVVRSMQNMLNDYQGISEYDRNKEVEVSILKMDRDIVNTFKDNLTSWLHPKKAIELSYYNDLSYREEKCSLYFSDSTWKGSIPLTDGTSIKVIAEGTDPEDMCELTYTAKSNGIGSKYESRCNYGELEESIQIVVRELCRSLHLDVKSK